MLVRSRKLLLPFSPSLGSGQLSSIGFLLDPALLAPYCPIRLSLMEEIYQNLGILNQWGSDSSNETSFAVTELWLEDASGKIKPRDQAVEAGGVHRWLSQHKRGFGEQAQSLVMRFVWVDVDVKDKVIRLSDSVRDVLLDSFGLKLAYDYSRSVISGVTAFPPRPSDPDFDQRMYSFCYIPKIASVWSHRRSTKLDGPAPLTQCIMFVQGDERGALKRGLQMSWDLSIYRNPMFPAFALSLLLGAQIDQSNGGIKVQLRKVEKRTGYSTFASRQGEEAATEELGSLSAQTSGSAAKLASTMRKTKTLERLLDFILRMVDEDESRLRPGAAQGNGPNGSIDPVSQSVLDGCGLLKTHVDLLKERQKNQLLDTEYILKRVQVQIDAVSTGFSPVQLGKITTSGPRAAAKHTSTDIETALQHHYAAGQPAQPQAVAVDARNRVL